MCSECSKKTVVKNAMKRIGWFLVVMCAVSCSSAWADINIIYSHGLANGTMCDGSWYSSGWPDDWYATEGTLSIGGPPVYGYSSYYSETANQTLYYASEVGISQESIYYAKAHAEASNPWIGDYLGDPSTSSWSGGNGSIAFTIDNYPLTLNWIAEGFERYEDTGWEIKLNRLTFTLEGTFVDPVYQTDSHQEPLSEGMQLFDLPPADAYELNWSIGIWSRIPGDHGWAQLSIDLTNLGSPEPIPAPGAVLLGSIGMAFAGWRLRRRKEL